MSVGRDVVVVQWTSWAVFGDFSEIFDQIFFNHWTEEQVGQDEHGRDANLFGVFGQIVDIGDGGATDLDHQHQIVFAAHLGPFFGDAFAFFDAKSCAFAHRAVDQNTLDSLLLQPASVLVDDVVVDGSSAETKLLFSRLGIAGDAAYTHLSALNGVNTGHIKPLK